MVMKMNEGMNVRLVYVHMSKSKCQSSWFSSKSFIEKVGGLIALVLEQETVP